MIKLSLAACSQDACQGGEKVGCCDSCVVVVGVIVVTDAGGMGREGREGGWWEG
jgi:hypothetical protein